MVQYLVGRESRFLGKQGLGGIRGNMKRELWPQIIRLARRGIYRQQIFFMFHDTYTEKAINSAIQRAVLEGMKSPDRCPKRGVYYHYGKVKV